MLSRVSRRVGNILPRSKRNEASNSEIPADDGTPETTAVRSVRLFCESKSAPDADGESAEYVHLPALIEAAESSPAAATAAATQIYKYIDMQHEKRGNQAPHIQYNAVMLIQLLSDNPGASFTRNFDLNFIEAIRVLLRNREDVATHQLLQRTLISLEEKSMHQPGVPEMVRMWRNERHGTHVSQPQGGQPSRRLPPPVELASRIEEARNTAKILIQFLSTTPAEEFLKNEFIHEFKDRCEAAQKSMSAYINCENPAPDVETLMTLIETNETLSIAMSRYQRCRLAAIQATGGASRTPDLESQSGRSGSWNGVQNNASNYGTRQAQNGTTAFANPPVLPPVQGQSNSLFAPRPQSAEANAFANGNDARQTSIVHDFASHPSQPSPSENPFADPRDVISTPEPPTESQRYSAQKSYVPVAPPSQTFNIDSEPSYPANGPATYQYSPKRNTSELEANNYTGSSQRPAYSTAGATPSYMGRQASAANGLTMHGAGGPLQNEVPEIDGSSGMGRTDSGRTAADSAYGVTPTEVRRR